MASDSLWSHRLQYLRLLCNPVVWVHSNSGPLGWWCHPTISFSAAVSFGLQSKDWRPSIRVFSSESALCIRWPKYWSFSFSISPFKDYSGLISFMIDWFDLLAIQGILEFSPKVQKHQFFGAQLSLWSNSHICTWLLEKPLLWLSGPLLTEWCLCFLIHAHNWGQMWRFFSWQDLFLSFIRCVSSMMVCQLVKRNHFSS